MSDRPGIGSGAALVPQGSIQLETGFEYDRLGSVVGRSYGQVLIRIGAPIELQVHLNSYLTLHDRRDPTTRFTGFQDQGFGVKVPVVRGAGDRFDLSFQGILTGPFGSQEVTADEWTQAVNVLADIAVAERVAVSVNVGRTASSRTPPTSSVIVTPAVALTDRWGAYTGWAADITDGEDTHFAEWGVTYLAANQIQLDVNGGWRTARNVSGPVPEARRWFVGAGIAIRGANDWLFGR